MKNFIKDLLTSGTGTSSKRFCGLCTVAVALFLALYAVIAGSFNMPIKESLVTDLVITLITGGAGMLGLTIFEKKSTDK